MGNGNKTGFEPIDDVVKKLKEVKFKCADEGTKQVLYGNLKEFGDNYKKLRDAYKEHNWLDPKFSFSKEEYDKFKTAHDNVRDGFRRVCNYIEDYGVNKEHYTSFQWAKALFTSKSDVYKYQGKFPVTMEQLQENVPYSKKRADGNDTIMFANLIEKVNNAVEHNVEKHRKHKNSKEFTNMMNELRRLKGALGPVKAGYHGKDTERKVSAEEAMKIGERMDSLKVAVEKYIKEKGGIGSQFTVMGRERMAMAVSLLDFVNEYSAKYPSPSRIKTHAKNIMNHKESYDAKQIAEAKEEHQMAENYERNQIVNENDYAVNDQHRKIRQPSLEDSFSVNDSFDMETAMWYK